MRFTGSAGVCLAAALTHGGWHGVALGEAYGTRAEAAIAAQAKAGEIPDGLDKWMSKWYDFVPSGMSAELQAEVKMVQVADERCEVCQIAVHKFCEILKGKLAVSSTKKGAIDIAVEEMMGSGEVCSYSAWEGMDQNAGISLDRLVTSCKGFMEEVGEVVDSVMPKLYLDEAKARRQLCVERTWVCKVVELWTDKNHILTRPNKPDINKRVSEAFSTWLQDDDLCPFGVLKPTASGLQYKIYEPRNTDPEAKHPTELDTVSVHYIGTHVDGRLFDSSFERGDPTTFGVTQVIKGWQEGLQLIKEGEWVSLAIPPEIGYGPEGTARIGGNEHLLFHLKLIKINPDKNPTPTPSDDEADDGTATHAYPTTDGSEYDMDDAEL